MSDLKEKLIEIYNELLYEKDIWEERADGLFE